MQMLCWTSTLGIQIFGPLTVLGMVLCKRHHICILLNLMPCSVLFACLAVDRNRVCAKVAAPSLQQHFCRMCLLLLGTI